MNSAKLLIPPADEGEGTTSARLPHSMICSVRKICLNFFYRFYTGNWYNETQPWAYIRMFWMFLISFLCPIIVLDPNKISLSSFVLRFWYITCIHLRLIWILYEGQKSKTLKYCSKLAHTWEHFENLRKYLLLKAVVLDCMCLNHRKYKF